MSLTLLKPSSRPRRNVRNGAIWFERYPPDHARYSYEEGFYVEALQVLHGWLEVKLQEWLLLGRHGNARVSLKEISVIAFEVPLLQSAKALFVTGKMPKSTFDAVLRFNAMRNKVIHQMFRESYEDGAISINVKDYDAALKIGLKLSDKLEWHLAKLATRGKVRNPKHAA